MSTTRSPVATTIVYNLGSSLEFTVPFEYLARKFVQLTLLGTTRQPLVLNTDYRFVSKTVVALSVQPGSEFTQIELRRYTSATERLVDFHDGSILRANELNLSQLQVLHVAEEARDLSLITLGTDENGDLDARNRKIVNLRDGTNLQDAASVNQLRGTESIVAQHASDAAASAAQAAFEAAKLGDMNALAAAVNVSLNSINFLKPLQVNGKLIHSLTDRYYSPKQGGGDESAELQAALDELHAAGGGKLFLPDSVMRCDTPLVGYTNMQVVGGPVTMLDFSHRADFMSVQDDGLMVFRGTATAPIALPTNAVKGVNKVRVADASIYKVGDLVELSMNDKGSYDDPSIGVKSGQLNRVTGVYTSTNNLVLDTIIFDTLYTSKEARIRLVTPVENSSVVSVGFKGKGRPTVTTQSGDQGLKFFYGVNVEARNCRFFGVDARSVDMVCCYGWRIADCTFKFDPLGEINQVSYGACYSSSVHGVISGNLILNARHGVVSSHLSSANANKYYGVSRFVLITGNTVTGNYGDLGTDGWIRAHAGISTHTDAEYLVIVGNTVSGCRHGINPRTWNIHIGGNILTGNKIGLYLSEAWSEVTFDGNIVDQCALAVSSPSTVEELERDCLRITNNTFRESGALNIVCSKRSKGLRITGNTINNSTAATSSGLMYLKGPWQGIIKDNSFLNAKAICIRVEGVDGLAVIGNTIEEQTGGGSSIYAVAGSKKVVIKDNILINANGISATGADCHIGQNIHIN